MAAFELDAVVLATDELSLVRIAGLTARERASRVAAKVGATRVHVVERVDDDELARWRAGRSCPLLVIRADQLVHTPLVAPLIEALPTLDRDGVAIAVVPDAPVVQDLPPGSYAGALLATGRGADDVIAGLADDTALVARLVEPRRVPHGPIARAPIATAEQRRQAHRVLYRILIKPQDNAITRYLYRPVSFPLTRLLVWTPITPNQISYVVAVLVALGCWLTAHASFNMVLLGTIVVLAASYVDCCDGEVARVKLLSSRFGAWIDTVVDELSSVGYMVALGWHCHEHFGPSFFGELPVDPWKLAIAISVVTYLWSIYCVYYNIIVAVGSANSQDYVGRFEVVPGSAPNTVRLAPAAAKAIATKEPLPPWLDFIATYAPYIVRRDFIAWASVLLAALHVTHLSFGLLAAGGLVSAAILTIDHLKLRSLRRSIERRGLLLDAP
ncbi:MAG TPA: CDP-alcohol phosphatidyltransferase family protein [Kofleriaceae bacterium]|nr:CDP-alcohol phosphatidyltransferase family protein [Kofleriaceae bacterium]